MKAPNLHLNLLHASERQSSSPVRLRVMLPILAAFACVGCLVWWGVLACQLMLVKLQNDAMRKDRDAKEVEYREVRSQKDAVGNAQAELDQLTMYVNGRRAYGKFLKGVIGVWPGDVQLLSLEIPEPPQQDLKPPGAKPGPKVKPLLGPTGTVENVSLRIRGRTPKVEAVKELMTALKNPEFGDVLAIAKDAAPDEGNLKVHSISQESRPSEDGVRQRVFDIEYRCTERRFEK